MKKSPESALRLSLLKTTGSWREKEKKGHLFLYEEMPLCFFKDKN